MMKRDLSLAVAGVAVILLSQTGAAGAQGAGAQSPPGAQVPSLDDLTATRDRPLFSSTRRPAAPPEEPAPAPAPIAEATSFPFELIGIVIGPDIRIAIFRKGEGTTTTDEVRPAAEEMRRKVGEKLGDWAVDEIADRFVILQGNGKRVRLRIFNEKDAGIQVGKPGAESDAVPDGDAASREGAEPADGSRSGPVDEEIVPTGTPKIVVPAPRTAPRPSARPGVPRPPNAQRPPNPRRLPGDGRQSR